MTKILKNVDFLKKMALKSVFMISPLFLDQIENFFIPKLSAKNSLQTLQVSSNFEMVDVNRWRKLAELPIDEFSLHIGADINALKNERIVIKSMVQSTTIADVVQFLNELIPFSDAFPQTIRMIENSITMPISQVTCERSFSKMKIIKNYLRNSMSDKRLSDLTVLAIERDFDINYERVIDAFSVNHKNSRILLR